MKDPRYMTARELQQEVLHTTRDREDARAQGATRTVAEASSLLRRLEDERRRRDPKGLRP